MDVWTEVINERFCDVHVGDFDIIVPITEEPVTRSEADHILEYVEMRKANEHHREERKQIQRNIEERAHARDRLEDAGYEPSEIPL